MKISLTGGYQDLNLGMDYQGSEAPVVDIRGNGQGWAKMTEGPVVIKEVPGRTTVRITGPGGGWYIKGPESIGG